MRKHLAVLGFFAVLTPIMTYPLVLHLADAVPGPPWDNFVWLYDLWWFRHTLFEQGISPWFNPQMFHPFGYDVTLSETILASKALALPWLLAGGEVVAFNAVVLLSFVLSGFTMYLLALRLTGNQWAALLSGVIYAFAPYRIHALAAGWIPLLPTQWLPLTFLYLERTLAGRRARPAALAGLFTALSALSSWYYAYMLAIILPIYVLVRARPWRAYLRDLRLWRCLLVFLVVLVGMAGPVALPAMGLGSSGLSWSLGYADRWSASLDDFVLPNVYHPLWGRFFLDLRGEVPEYPWYAPGFIYLGIAPLLLSIWALRRQGKAEYPVAATPGGRPDGHGRPRGAASTHETKAERSRISREGPCPPAADESAQPMWSATSPDVAGTSEVCDVRRHRAPHGYSHTSRHAPCPPAADESAQPMWSATSPDVAGTSEVCDVRRHRAPHGYSYIGRVAAAQAWSGAISAVLALGTTLHVFSARVYIPVPGWLEQQFSRLMIVLAGRLALHPAVYSPLRAADAIPIPLPGFLAFVFLPLFSAMRHWYRFGIITTLAVAVLASLGAALLLKQRQSGRQALLGIGLVAIVLVDFLSAPLPYGLSYTSVVQPVDRWLAQQPGDFAVMQFPLVRALNGPMLYRGIVHGKKMAYAHGTFYPPAYVEAEKTLGRFPEAASLDMLREWDVRYVLVGAGAFGAGWGDVPGQTWESVEKDINASGRLKLVQVFDEEPFWKDETVSAVVRNELTPVPISVDRVYVYELMR